jgi:hypothetical protein
MTMLEDEEAQRKGMVFILYDVQNLTGIQRMTVPGVATASTKMIDSIPFRLTGLHYCYDDPMIRPAISIIQHIIGTHGRLRFRAHFGEML